MHVVSARTDYGTIRWWIDAERGWSPLRVTLEQDGEIEFESRSSLRRYGEVWFPEKVVFFGGGEVREVVEVHRAEFNEPGQPHRLAPAHIGVEVGTVVDRYTSRGGPPESLVWDGESTVSAEEFTRRLVAGELSLGPRVAQALTRYEVLEIATARGSESHGSKGRFAGPRDTRRDSAQPADPMARDDLDASPPGGGPATTTRPTVDDAVAATFASRWERYTQDFIVAYRLDTEQEQKALLILRECQAQARVYLASREAALRALEERMSSLAAQSGSAQASEREAIVAQRSEIFGWIDKIFEKQLKPRLERLPSRAQRRHAQPVGEVEQP